MKDFFVSYTGVDQRWAEWIAWVLEENGHSVVIQAWDFRPGGNFILDMQRATAEAERTVMVLSDAYLQATYTHPEWAAALKQDPTASERKLLPIRVAPCQPTGMLAPLGYVDLVDKSEAEAEQVLLESLQERAKPTTRPTFPKSVPVQARVTSAAAPFPGFASSASEQLATQLMVNPSSTPPPKQLTSLERLKLIQTLNQIPTTQFEELLGALNPPAGVVPSDSAPRGGRTAELLRWVEGPGGCGLSELQQVLSVITGNPA